MKPASVVWVLVVMGAALLPGDAAGDAPTDDVPVGMVAFFSTDVTACPTGWKAASQTWGRLVLAVTDSAGVGATVGTPLADREDRAHSHDLAGSVDLTARNIAGADGSNNNGAASGTTEWTAQTAPATTGLPFVQLLACEKL